MAKIVRMSLCAVASNAFLDDFQTLLHHRFTEPDKELCHLVEPFIEVDKSGYFTGENRLYRRMM